MSPILLGILAAVALMIIVGTIKAPRLMSVLIWSFVATVLFSAAIILMWPGPLSNKLLWMALLSPIIWVALQFWCYWQGKGWRVVLAMLAISVLGALAVALVDPVL